MLFWCSGLYLYLGILKPRKYRSIFKQLPVMKIAHMSIGAVVIQGRFITEHNKIDAPFEQGKCDGYRYQYYKGSWRKNGEIDYVLDHEKSDYNVLKFQDKTDEIALDASAIQPLYGEWEKIKLGIDLVKIKCLKLNHDEEYMLAGNYQIQEGERRILSLDKCGIYYLSKEEGEWQQYQQKNLYFFQAMKRYGIVTALFVLIAMTVLNVILPPYYVNPLVLIWCYFVGSILFVFYMTKVHKVQGLEHIWNSTIILSLFPNIGVMVLSMLLGVSLLPLMAALTIVLMQTYKFVQKYPDEIQDYLDKRPNQS
ncbi:hypothetical protein GCM10023338_02560 [Wohlfahrtiimonas larvae]|uniref:DUF805 domain-containing protein n=2 Tax=Wohlfahrtiimonas larvae TaxID=1157986 RepID=A0ABP9MFK6_9GAMM